jgi:hypothetical protein
MSVHSLFSRTFWIATVERAIRSFAASLASLLTAGGTGVLDTDWGEKFSVAAMAAVVTVLFAVGGGTIGKGNGPSFIGEEDLAAAKPAPAQAPPMAAAGPPVPAQAAAPAAEQLPAGAPAPVPVV